MKTAQSTRRKRFEADTFPHLDALWRTAQWLTMRENLAENLVLRTMKRAYRLWHKPADAVSHKTRLFRVLSRTFFGANPQVYKSGRYLSENCGSAAFREEGNGHHNEGSISHQQLPVLMRVPQASVMGAIARMRPKSRLMMILLFREQLSYADIAYITDLQDTSVKAILRRLRRLIPVYLAELAQPAAEAKLNAEWTHGSVRLRHKSETVSVAFGSGWEVSDR